MIHRSDAEIHMQQIRMHGNRALRMAPAVYRQVGGEIPLDLQLVGYVVLTHGPRVFVFDFAKDRGVELDMREPVRLLVQRSILAATRVLNPPLEDVHI